MTSGAATGDEPLALLGGTFDPVHYGHLRCAEQARRELSLEYLYLLPAGQPPHRGDPQASAAQRLEMLALAREEFPRLLIDDRETRRAGPSYMVDTLQELRTIHPDRPLLLLIGQDAANQLHSWHHWRRLFDLAHIVILTRPEAHIEYEPDLAAQVGLRAAGDTRELADSPAGRILQLDVEPVDVSATAIKRHIRSGKTPRRMLPEAVLAYITENRLYLDA